MALFFKQNHRYVVFAKKRSVIHTTYISGTGPINYRTKNRYGLDYYVSYCVLTFFHLLLSLADVNLVICIGNAANSFVNIYVDLQKSFPGFFFSFFQQSTV